MCLMLASIAVLGYLTVLVCHARGRRAEHARILSRLKSYCR